ncbi:DNA-deoxyinosine glycosylase [Sphingomonas piscis]|uniref:DNA-deoxyinosine glycosylase n=1 Tax=Sphingomonas piscis TaxID=2714943 RepID=A0A6G7YR30_9SPHN|nr:DNA-deoxyinosine glycosylase [Sphingomonas piscis]QIK79193.1 DNA-deoxyinosine glycosylase [Sphingomonas piscis]
MLKIGLPPVAPNDATLFILGSLPGDASLAAQRYYAHPTNQFWRLLGSALDEPLADLDYQQRLERLAGRQVGLWDVIASARRPGSLDQAIRDPEHNALETLLDRFPQVRAVAFNGTAAAKAGLPMLEGRTSGLHLITLPSSSAANTATFAAKSLAWAELSRWAGAKRLHEA